MTVVSNWQNCSVAHVLTIPNRPHLCLLYIPVKKRVQMLATMSQERRRFSSSGSGKSMAMGLKRKGSEKTQSKKSSTLSVGLASINSAMINMVVDVNNKALDQASERANSPRGGETVASGRIPLSKVVLLCQSTHLDNARVLLSISTTRSLYPPVNWGRKLS